VLVWRPPGALINQSYSGHRSLYESLWMWLPLWMQVSHGAIQFMVYEELRALAQTVGGPPEQRTRWDAWQARQRQGGGSGESDGRPDEAAGPWGWRRRRKAEAHGGPPLRQPSSAEIVGMGALSKLAASVITYPSQVGSKCQKSCHFVSDCAAMALSPAAAMESAVQARGLCHHQPLADGGGAISGPSAHAAMTFERLPILAQVALS